MKRIVFGFLFVLFAFNVNAKDLYESGLDKFQNAQSTISKSTLPNNDQTDAIIAEAKQLMPDEDWAKIDAMDGDKKLIYVRNLLAVKAYETLRKEWMDDFKAQVEKRNDTVWESGDESNALYMRESAKKYYANEHKDADIHCEKMCFIPGRWGKDAVAYFDGCEDADKWCVNVTQIPDEYEELWFHETSNETPEQEAVGSTVRKMMYLKDSFIKNKQIVYDAYLIYDDVSFDTDDEYSHTNQSITLRVGKETKKLSDDRELENASRRDDKNGKILDSLQNNGRFTKKWSPADAGGHYQAREFDFSWQSDKSQN